MLRLLLTGAGDFRNKGDVAILEGTINVLTSLGIPITKVYSPYVPIWPDRSVNGIKMEQIPSFNTFNKMLAHGLFSSFSEPISTAMFLAPKLLYKTLSKLSKSNILNDLSLTDLIWQIGGSDLIHDNRFIDQVLPVLYLKKKWKSRKLVILGGHSIGPFYSHVSRFSASTFLSNFVDILLLREKRSLEYLLNKLKIRLPYTQIISDFSFHVNPRNTHKVQEIFKDIDVAREGASNGCVIGLSARPWFYHRWTKKRSKMRNIYLNFLVNVVKKLCDKGFSVVFYPSSTVPGTADDAEVYNFISRLLNVKNTSYSKRFTMLRINQLSGSEAYAVPRKLDAMVALRSHSAIAALKSFIPTIHIYYHHKGEGIIKHLRAQVPCISLDEVTSMNITPDELVKIVEQQIKNYDEISEDIRISVKNRISEDVKKLHEIFEKIDEGMLPSNIRNSSFKHRLENS